MDEQKNGIAKLPRQTRAERLNTALYKKMFAEQERYRAWLLSQTPEEILNHTYEYTTREDILLCMEYEEISAKQALALLALPDPLNTVFDEYDRLLNSHMQDISEAICQRADMEIEWQQEQRASLER